LKGVSYERSKEAVMPSLFQEFSRAFEKFVLEFPDHPLTEQIRRAIGLDRFPDEDWLRENTGKMRDLMEPLWRRNRLEAVQTPSYVHGLSPDDSCGCGSISDDVDERSPAL
jgi:hypothetical protein